jgi:hypothetical protein
VSTDLSQQIEPQPTTRVDLARQLLARVDRLAPRLGAVPLAIELQLLKRELARGHAVLAGRSEDNNFLSVLTLVEAALASLTWKDYSLKILDALRLAFSAGLREGAFSFDQYETVRRHFKASGIRAGPIIDLDVAAAAEDEDDSQA